MNYVEIEKQQKALTEWLAEKDFTTFGTLKFTDGAEIGEAKAEKEVRKYFSMLDRAYYGNAVTNSNMRHDRIVFKHMGTSQANLHYHFLARPHTCPMLFAQLARKQWANLSTWTINYASIDIKTVRSNEAACSYMLHEYRKLGADCIILQASALNLLKSCPLKYRNIAQMRRLLSIKNMSANELEYSTYENDALYNI